MFATTRAPSFRPTTTVRGQELNAARLRMARVPDGATLIDNPVSAAPGFTLGNVHVMAGVPSIFEAMLAGVLPTLTGGPPVLSQSLRVRAWGGRHRGRWASSRRRIPRFPSAPTRSNATGCTARTSSCAARTARRWTGSWPNWRGCFRRPDDPARRYHGDDPRHLAAKVGADASGPSTSANGAGGGNRVSAARLR
jgi:hypothetical protein